MKVIDTGKRDSKFTKQKSDRIKWADYSWNPIFGCEYGCLYCYARDQANHKFKGDFTPKLYLNRLQAPFNTKPEATNHPSSLNVFLGSMADMFGPWVDNDSLNKVLDVCRQSPQWRYLTLTKNPARLPEISFPDNLWVGSTVDSKRRINPALDGLRRTKSTVKFISCEPLLEDLGPVDLSGIDWLIIGAQTAANGVPRVSTETGVG